MCDFHFCQPLSKLQERSFELFVCNAKYFLPHCSVQPVPEFFKYVIDICLTIHRKNPIKVGADVHEVDVVVVPLEREGAGLQMSENTSSSGLYDVLQEG